MDVIEEQPGGREPAPGTLALVQTFVNTKDIEGRRERLSRPEPAHEWLVEHGLLDGGERVSEADFIRLLEVREALRALALANNGLALDDGAVELLNREAARTLAVEFALTGEALRPVGAGVDRAVGRLLAIVLKAMRDSTWTRMKACRRDVCRWLFYDHSRNRRSSWCSMAICGNRTKTQSYRRRRKRTHAQDR